MPNRIIKESICTSDSLAVLSPEAERLFYRLMVQCDDFGLFYANLNIIRSRCFQLTSDAIKEKQLSAWLDELEKANLLFFYEVDGKKYLKYTNWEKHQRIRAQNAKFPLPDSDSIIPLSSDVNGQQATTSDVKCGRIRNRIRIRESYSDNPELDKAIDSFVEMRKSIKKPLTENALDLLVTKLGKMANDDATKIAILEQSIMNSWQGIFQLKNAQVNQVQFPEQPQRSRYREVD